jgi:drug/metabolite transporter (DMT)-like permease
MGVVIGGVGAGAGLAVSTAVVWGISPMFMASVGRRIGSWHTNLLRVFLAFLVLCFLVLPAYWFLRGGVVLPRLNQCGWLAISGLVGMVIGDACYYEALVLLGPRRAVKLNTLAPVVGLGVGAFWQHETLDGRAMIGAALVIAAVMYAALANSDPPEGESREPGKMSALGLLCGLISATCIGLGSVLGRQAYRVQADAPLDAIAATVVRVGFAAIVLWTFALVRGQAGRTLKFLSDGAVRQRLAWGTLLGPIVGMLGFVSALKFAPAGLVSTIISTSPLVILPVVAVKYGVRIRPAVVCALLAEVVGVGMMFWK